MNLRHFFWSLAALIAARGFCADKATVTLEIDPTVKHQTIEGFGTCIVTWLPDKVARYQEDDFPEFYLKTLGASVLRIDLWSGSVVKKQARWQDISHRDFSFEGAGARGQVFVDVASRLHAASGGKLRVIASVWSPPDWMKINGSMLSGKPKNNGRNYALDFNNPVERGLWYGPQEGADGEDRYRHLGQNKLRPDHYLHYAKLLVEWTRYFRSLGLDLYAISPQNEPRFSHWFESCVYTPEEYAELLRVIAWMFQHEGEKQPQLFGPEHMTHDIARNRLYLEAIASRPTALAALGAIASHGYVDGYAVDQLPGSSGAFRKLAEPYGKKIWMTEGATGRHAWPAPLHEVGAAFLNALTDGGVSLLTPWQVIGSEPDEHSLALMRGTTKKTSIVMQYWRFIRPGMVRVEVHGENGPLGTAAFQDPVSERLVLVLLNRTKEAAPGTVILAGKASLRIAEAFVTDATRDCATVPKWAGKSQFILPAESMATLVLEPSPRP